MRSLAFLRAFVPAVGICLFCGGAALAQVPPRPSPGPSAPPVMGVPTAGAIALDPWLDSNNLWQTTEGFFPATVRQYPFRWVSATHDAARAASPALTLAGLPVAEVIVRFTPSSGAATTSGPAPAPTPAGAPEGKLLTSVQVSIYNRGDAGDLDQKTFDALVVRSKDALAKLTKATPTDRGTDNASAVQSRGVIYQTAQSRFLLEWSATAENRVQGIPYRAEFVRLRVSPLRDQPKNYLEQLRSQADATAGTPKVTTIHAADLPARVVKAADGSEHLPGIPMVDQGQKGYCVTASVERVLRYYGVEVDQNELAQIANTETEGGTSTEAMVGALKKLASKFKVNVITEINPTYQDFLRGIDDYNRAARNAPKALGATQIDTRAGILSYDMIYSQMKGEVLRDARTKLNPAFQTRFEREIQTRLDRGIPLLWSVMLGLLPEEKVTPQMRGGHMRLIIGYNAKTHEIFYTDSWGMGHELKKMPAANAWTITTGLFSLEPI